MDTTVTLALQLQQFQAGFLGQIAHELRSPMSHIMSLQQLILADLCEDPAEEREFIAQCYVASQKFMALIDLAVDVSKLECGRGHIRQDSFDFMTLMGELATTLQVKAKNRNLRLQIDAVTEQDELLLVGDRPRLFQTLLILIDTTITNTTAGEIAMGYGRSDDGRILWKIQTRDTTDFWENTTGQDITLSSHPTPREVKQAAQQFAFSPNLNWQLCQNLVEAMGGNLGRETDPGTIQVQGWLPLDCKK